MRWQLAHSIYFTLFLPQKPLGLRTKHHPILVVLWRAIRQFPSQRSLQGLTNSLVARPKENFRILTSLQRNTKVSAKRWRCQRSSTLIPQCFLLFLGGVGSPQVPGISRPQARPIRKSVACPREVSSPTTSPPDRKKVTLRSEITNRPPLFSVICPIVRWTICCISPFSGIQLVSYFGSFGSRETRGICVVPPRRRRRATTRSRLSSPLLLY